MQKCEINEQSEQVKNTTFICLLNTGNSCISSEQLIPKITTNLHMSLPFLFSI